MTENKLGLTDREAVHEAEERLSKRRARELFDNGLLAKTEVGTFKGLADIHRYLFSDMYDSAGTVRTVDIVRGNTRFAPVNILDTSLGFVDIMPQSTFDDVVDKYIEMNVAHPFRQGNGRSMRIWLNVLMYSATGAVIDYAALDRDKYLDALAAASVDDEALYEQLRRALVKGNSREVYLRGVDASYAFEGYALYKTENV